MTKHSLPIRAKDRLPDCSDQYGAVTRHRLRAVVDEALDMLTGQAEDGKPRKHEDGRDVYEVLADAILADPLGALERLTKMLPGAPADAGNGANVSIGNLYLAAVQAANATPKPVLDVQVIDAEPVTSGVQPGFNEW